MPYAEIRYCWMQKLGDDKTGQLIYPNVADVMDEETFDMTFDTPTSAIEYLRSTDLLEHAIKNNWLLVVSANVEVMSIKRALANNKLDDYVCGLSGWSAKPASDEFPYFMSDVNSQCEGGLDGIVYAPSITDVIDGLTDGAGYDEFDFKDTNTMLKIVCLAVPVNQEEVHRVLGEEKGTKDYSEEDELGEIEENEDED